MRLIKKSRYMPPKFVADGFKKLPSNDSVYSKLSNSQYKGPPRHHRARRGCKPFGSVESRNSRIEPSRLLALGAPMTPATA